MDTFQVTVSTPSRLTPYSTEVNTSLVRLGRALAGGHLPAIARAVFSHDELQHLVELKMLDILNSECSTLCKRRVDPPSPFRKMEVSQLAEFKWSNFIQDLEVNAPTLLKVFSTIASHSDHRNNHKLGERHFPGICMAISTLLKERNREMCGIQTMLSLILFTSRAQKQVLKSYIIIKLPSPLNILGFLVITGVCSAESCGCHFELHWHSQCCYSHQQAAPSTYP